jgi:hypothetical protein
MPITIGTTQTIKLNRARIPACRNNSVSSTMTLLAERVIGPCRHPDQRRAAGLVTCHDWPCCAFLLPWSRRPIASWWNA